MLLVSQYMQTFQTERSTQGGYLIFFFNALSGFLSVELKAQMERKVKMKPKKNNTQKYTESKFASNFVYIKLKVYNTIYSFDYHYRYM